jgi:hypothetical protein
MELLQRMSDLASNGRFPLPNFAPPLSLDWISSHAGFIDTSSANDSHGQLSSLISSSSSSSSTTTALNDNNALESSLTRLENSTGESVSSMIDRLNHGESIELTLIGKSSSESNADHFVATLRCFSTSQGNHISMSNHLSIVCG